MRNLWRPWRQWGIPLLWLAAPTFLPLSTGPDLTHHLLLIRYIEEHWRLVHDPSVERFLGEMAQYTPGSHVLVAFAGSVARTDGLRALHAVQAVTVALKVVFLVFVDESLALIELKQRGSQLPSLGVGFGGTDFAAVARAMLRVFGVPVIAMPIEIVTRGSALPFMLRSMQPLMRSCRSRTPPSRGEGRG